MHQNKNKNQSKLHQPVLLEPVLELLAPASGQSYLDLTAGYGGHASAVLAVTKSPKKVTLVDRDKAAISHLGQALPKAEMIHSDYLSASQQLVANNRQFDMIFADLGVSSPHLNEASRGFSLTRDGPLDMRMDTSQALTAEQIVNSWSEPDLAKILRDFGEEPKARRIAGLIADHRPISSTKELADVVKKAWPGRSRVHPATRTFQALRMAVNDELGQLSRSLPLWLQMLEPAGRLAIISFHSLEDRLVKRFFSDEASMGYDAGLKLLTKRPIMASATEIAFNPRARSAKLRAAVKIKNQTERS